MLKRIEELFLYFIMYSIIGWIYEVFLEVVVYKWGFSNRGILFGPYCPVYGFGVLAFLFTIYPLIKNKTLKQKLIYIPLVFLGCMGIATFLELITSYICEFFMGSWPWQTYARDYEIHFQGRIALSPSLRFGLGGTVFLYILQPLFEKMLNKLGEKKVSILAIVFGVIIIGDCVYTFNTNNLHENYEWDSSLKIFESRYANMAWGDVDQGYRIYADGYIEEFDYSNKDRTLKKAKLNDEELKKLKILLCLVKDKFREHKELGYGADMGRYVSSVYSPKLEKEIVLNDSISGYNNTRESKKILKLAQSLQDKYLNE